MKKDLTKTLAAVALTTVFAISSPVAIAAGGHYGQTFLHKTGLKYYKASLKYHKLRLKYHRASLLYHKASTKYHKASTKHHRGGMKHHMMKHYAMKRHIKHKRYKVPEIDGSTAPLALGLSLGVIALIRERRRRLS